MIEIVIPYRIRNIGSMDVRRVLPYAKRRMVGPFVFVDEMGPVEMVRDASIDVLPHPHIGLSTVTYLFQGKMMHRDSLGTEQMIAPGEVNLMTAGRGIVHSERVSDAPAEPGEKLLGIQTWLALPEDSEESEPAFAHYGIEELPVIEDKGLWARVITGLAFGKRSPVETMYEALYAECRMAGGEKLRLPDDTQERSVYIVDGALNIEGSRFEPGNMVVFTGGSEAIVDAEGQTRFMIIGGERPEKKRFMWWNFVSSRFELIEQAKKDWAEQNFVKIPGDSEEFVPLPDIGNPNPMPQPL